MVSNSLKAVHFSYNWNNKLSCNYFTTIRRKNPIKYKIGEKYDITYGEGAKLHVKFRAEIVEIRNIRFKDINPFIAGLDTGYSLQETKNILHKMYKLKMDFKEDFFSFILFKKLKPEQGKLEL